MPAEPTRLTDEAAAMDNDQTPGRRRMSGSDVAMSVAPVIRVAAAWTWRLLLLALAAFLVVELLSRLRLLVLPLCAALFFTALLQPLAQLLRRARLTRSLAAIVPVLLACSVLVGVGIFTVQRGAAAYPDLVDQATNVVRQADQLLRRTPFGAGTTLQVDHIQQQVLDYLAAHRGALAQGAFSGLRVVLEVLTAVVLGIFFTLFFLYDGKRIWDWLVRLAPKRHQQRVGMAGQEAWHRVGGFVRGTFVIALFHAVVIGAVLWLLGIALIAPLTLLVFFGSFIPIIGAVIFGGLALLVTLVSHGFLAALIFLVVLIVDNQIEAHILQPFLVGRYVHLHPVAVAIAITSGALLAGIPGAIVAIPLVSASHGAVRILRRRPSPVAPSPADEPTIP